MLDEVKSDFQLTILDASYVANRAQAGDPAVMCSLIDRLWGVAAATSTVFVAEAAPVDEVHMVPVARTCLRTITNSP